MAMWSTRANQDMIQLMGLESPDQVASIRADISRWADTVNAEYSTRAFQGTLRFSVIAGAKNREIISVEHD